jgi:cyclase
MLRPRIIPCLLVRNRGLVKTVGFRDGKYVGDPINAVRIFNEKEADELMVLDIDATAKGAEPDMRTIEVWAAACRMPLCYGGGIKTVDQAKAIIGLGVEKIALSAAALEHPELVAEMADALGGQSVVVVLDVRKSGQRYEIWTHNATRNTGRTPREFARELQTLGAGEVVINSIDRDGMMKGYDFELVDSVRENLHVPLTVLGGAGSLDDIAGLLRRFGTIGASAGSCFVFKGVYKAVLINYPSPDTKDQLISSSLPA